VSEIGKVRASGLPVAARTGNAAVQFVDRSTAAHTAFESMTGGPDCPRGEVGP